MTLEWYLSRVITDTSDPTFLLMTRCVKALEARGFSVARINGVAMITEANLQKVGDRMISVKQVYRSNGTKENVSVDIMVDEVCKASPYYASHELCKVRVRTDLSDKAFNNRIDKVIASL